MNRKMQITIEKHSITIIRTKGKANSVFCQHCQQKVAAFSIEQFAAIFQMEANAVCRKVQAGEIHLVAGEGGALVCGNSLEIKSLE